MFWKTLVLLGLCITGYIQVLSVTVVCVLLGRTFSLSSYSELVEVGSVKALFKYQNPSPTCIHVPESEEDPEP